MQEYDFEIHYKKGLLQVVAYALSRNVSLGNDEIASFKEVKDTRYNRRIEEVLKNSKKFPDWIVIDNMLYEFTKNDLLDPLYDREKGWRSNTESKLCGMPHLLDV